WEPQAETQAERLGERSQKGDEAANTLLKLGVVKGQSTTGREALFMSENWSDFFNHYAIDLLHKIETGSLPLDKAVFPAFVLIKTGVRNDELEMDLNPENFSLVRPFLDPWPAKVFYKFLAGDSAQLSSRVFKHFIVSGKYPFGSAGFAGHEMAHFSELYR